MSNGLAFCSFINTYANKRFYMTVDKYFYLFFFYLFIFTVCMKSNEVLFVCVLVVEGFNVQVGVVETVQSGALSRTIL